MIPISSQTSQKCLRSYLVQVRGQWPRQAGPSCHPTARGYVTTTSPANTKNTAAGPPKSTKAARTKAPRQISASGARTAARATRAQAQLEKEKMVSVEDPDAALQQVTQVSSIHAGIDAWAIDPSILDLTMPVRNGLPLGLNRIKYMLDNWQNSYKNAQSIYLLGSAKILPPLYSVPEFPYESNIRPPACPVPDKIKWYQMWEILIPSTSPKAWHAGIPGLSLHLYLQMCKAIAESDKTTLKRVTCSVQQIQAQKIAGARDPDTIYTWKFIKENTPTRVVSIRVVRGYFAKQEPRNGLNRMLIQALVRFDTTQSLGISVKRKQRGAKVNKSANATAATSIDEGNVTTKRVVEYYVIQKKGWVAGPWAIKEKIYDTSGFEETLDGDVGGEAKGNSVVNRVAGGLSGFVSYLKQRIGGR